MTVLGHLDRSTDLRALSLAGARVLVVGINYAPEHTGISPYTSRACQHFASCGAEVLVLAGVPHYPHWTVPDAYRRRLSVDEAHGAVQVRRLRHHVPARQSALRRAVYEATFGAHVAAQQLPWRPTVVLAVVPSLLGAAAAAAIAERYDAPLAVWVQDLMGPATSQSGIAGGSAISRVTARIERSVLRRASTVAVIDDSFRRYAEEAGVAPERVHVVPNWSHVAAPTADRAATRRALGWAAEDVLVLHSGNMGLKQGLDNVVAAGRLAAARGSALRFVLMGDGSQREALVARAQGVPNVELLPPVSDERFPDVLAAADVLLVNERAMTSDMSLPSKLTSYFQAGRPVVAAVAVAGGTAREVRRSGAGVVVPPDDPGALVRALEALARDPGQMAAMSQRATRHSAEHLHEHAALSRLGSLLTAC